MSNVISAVFRENHGNQVYTRDAYQYDHGMILRISGIALPEQYQVHFSNEKEDGLSVSVSVSGSDVAIPDVFFESGKFIYIWIYMTDENELNTGNSEYTVVIPVVKRPNVYKSSSGKSGELAAELDEEEHALYFRWR